jgi:hypothetical protein
VLKEADDPPAILDQNCIILPVPLYVACKLRCPIAPICFWNLPVFWTSVPEAAIDKYCDLGASEDHIGPDTPSPEVEGQILAKSQPEALKL